MSQAVDKLTADTETLDGSLEKFIDAGKAMEGALVHVESVLNLPSTVESDLKKITGPLNTIKDLLLVAALVPQLRAAADNARTAITEILVPIERAENALGDFDKKIEPIKAAVEKAKDVIEKFNTEVEKFQRDLATYSPNVNSAQNCITALPDGSVKTNLQNNLDGVAEASDTRVVQLNGLLVTAIRIATDAKDYVIDTLDPLFQPFRDLQEAIRALETRLEGILEPLQELKKLMDFEISVSFPYPCPEWTDPLKICWYPISFSVQEILDGIGAIEKEMERILSTVLMEALKFFGLDKLFNELIQKADAIIAGVVQQITKILDSLDINIPGLADIQKIIADLQAKLDGFLGMIVVDVQPMYDLMERIEADIAAFRKVYEACTASPEHS